MRISRPARWPATGAAGPAAHRPSAVEVVLWRAVVAYRIATLVYAGALLLRAHQSYARPAAGLAVLGVMVGWTALMTAANLTARGRRAAVVAADLAMAVALTLSSLWVQTWEQSHGGAATLPTTWSASPVLAAALVGGPWGGVAGAAVVGLSTVVVRGTLTVATFNNIVLLFLAGAVGGYVVRLAVRAQRRLAQATRLEAATRERERLARTIHDGVLQVLALMQRRGAEIGGEAAELGRLAGEQEAALRALVRSQRSAADGPPADPAATDLRPLLLDERDAAVEVSAPATPVLVESETARELTAAVRAALDNVRQHAGPAARAWVLVEDLDDRVLVTVRDDGVGIAPGRLDEAAAQGRLGVACSLRERVESLGGTVRIDSAPGRGTEVELDVPKLTGPGQGP